MKRTLTLLALLLAGYGASAQFGGYDYVYVGAAGMNASAAPSMIYTTKTPHNPASFTYLSTITGIDFPGKMNAVGLSCIDGFLYGMQFPNVAAVNFAALYRVNAQTGNAIKLGTIDPPPVSGSSYSLINTTAGTLDQGDNYYFTAYTYSGDLSQQPYDVNNLKVFLGKVPTVGGLPVAPPGGVHVPVQYTELEFLSDPGVTAAFTNFLNHFDYTNPSNSDGGAEDIAINPNDGQFYSYMSYPDPSNPSQLLHRPIRINPASKNIRVVGTTVNSSPNREIAGAYFDIDPGTYAVHFFVLFTNGEYGTVNLTTGALNYPLSVTPFPLASGSNLRGDLANNVCVIPLPVELISFTGRNLGDYNLLEWQTAKEENIDKVILERSSDAREFSVITSLPPKGNNSQYRYQDTYEATAFYRLRFVNLDGSSEYSPTVYLKRNTAGTVPNVVIYPTELSASYFTVSGLDQQATITVLSMEGKTISRMTTDASSLQVPLTAAPGVYLVTVADKNGYILSTQRIVRK